MSFNITHYKDLNNDIDNVGVLAIGSYLKDHGSDIPLDSESKVASYIALNASISSGAKYLGVIFNNEISSDLESANNIEYEIIKTLISAKKYFNIKSVVIVNLCYENFILIPNLDLIEEQTGLYIVLNNHMVTIYDNYESIEQMAIGRFLGFFKSKINIDKYLGNHLIDSGIRSVLMDIEKLSDC